MLCFTQCFFNFIIYLAIKCPSLKLPKNAERIQCSDDQNFGSVCAFQCITGYKLIGELIIICIGHETSTVGLWNGNIPRCQGKIAIFRFLYKIINHG